MKFKPTTSELGILTILWNNGPLKVRAVNDIINRSKEVGYTSTLKTMQVMFEKNLLSREKDGKSHIYNSAVNRDESQTALLGKMVKHVFGGSTKNLVMRALGNSETTKEELDEIRAYLDTIERGVK